MMKTFPMFLVMEGRRVVILGGGEQAAQKMRLFRRTAAEITLFALDFCDEIAAEARAGHVTTRTGPITVTDLSDAALVVIATGCCMADRVLQGLAKTAGATVNVVDRPGLCDALTPAFIDRAPVVVAIGTEGTAPVLGRQIKTRVEEMLSPDLGDLAAYVGSIRPRVAERFEGRARRDFYRWVFADAPREVFERDGLDAAQRLIEQALDTGALEAIQTPSLSVVEAAPDGSDMIVLRGVQRLQEADVVSADPAVAQYLDLARRDADRLDWGAALPVGDARVVVLVPVGQGRTLSGRLAAEFIAGPGSA